MEGENMLSTARFACLLLLGATVAALPRTADAQDYPNKPLRLVLPYNPGGIIDYVGRNLAQRLSQSMGQQVVAENRPGAGGIVGTDAVARSAPDGYTMVLMDPGIVINPSLQKDIVYDFFKQLQTVSIVGSSPPVLVVSNHLPVKTFQELIAYGKANPGKLNFASAGIGTAPHLAGELVKLRAGIDMTHVPYRGIGPSYADLMSGKIQLSFSSIAGALPFTTDGRVRPIATAGLKRSAVFPDLPTIAESGLEGFEVDLWTGIFAPAGIPPAVLSKLNAEIAKVLQQPDMKEALAKVGVEPRGTSLDEGAKIARSEYEKWAKVIKDAKITMN
jgi:tripartite-type tricarboxylate transporter receptor subunit TctC